MVQLPDNMTPEQVRAAVRARYSAVAESPAAGHGFPVGRAFAEAVGYPRELLDALPAAAADAFAGVACPVPHAGLQPGEFVADLGCGGGLDSLYAARCVGPTGRVIGLDFSPAMVERARRTVATARAANVEVRLTDGLSLPVDDGAADAVLVNGIFNLHPDKRVLPAEVCRVLRPGGRLVAAEIALRAPLPEGEGRTLDDWFRWIGGAQPEGDLLESFAAVGFERIMVLDRFRNARTGAEQSIVLLIVAHKPLQ